jgi:hypothetical protein
MNAPNILTLPIAGIALVLYALAFWNFYKGPNGRASLIILCAVALMLVGIAFYTPYLMNRTDVTSFVYSKLYRTAYLTINYSSDLLFAWALFIVAKHYRRN